ncbi:hypothetical protein GCM10011316_31630 [Roseibium aquae]|uniref:Small-conductance mechanosensitive channel n=2 Tax=Roseibium aquae TaxID=1323746 RepID=A0A916X1K4_9HYPH|nr:hypothetical protein GCM10011316_31630 [Roseibium aquae]
MPICAAFLGLLIGGLSPATAQERPKDVPENLQPAAIQELVDRLDPDQLDALSQLMQLITEGTQSTAMTPPPVESLPFLDKLDAFFDQFIAMLAGYFSSIPDLVQAAIGSIGALVQGQLAGPFIPFLGLALALTALGFAAELVFNRFTRKRRDAVRTNKPESLFQTVKMVSTRFALDAGGLFAFAVVVLIGGRVAGTATPAASLAMQAIFLMVVMPRLIGAILRFALAPHRPELRLVRANNWTATFIYKNLIVLFAVVGAALFFNKLIVLSGYDLDETFRFFVGLAVNTWILLIIWKARKGLTEIILGDEEQPSTGLERMAYFWPYFSMAFVAFNWLLVRASVVSGQGVLTGEQSLGVITLVLFAPFLDTMVRGIVSHVIPPMQGVGPVAEAAYLQTRHSYIRIARVALLTALILSIARIYGVDLLSFGAESSSTVGQNAVGFLLILAAGYLAWELVSLWVNHQLAKDSPPAASNSEDAEMGGAGKSRIATILPLLKVTLQVTIIVLTTLLALAQIGVNITPLLAGAGVLGLAVGFGAQTLVRDVVSGVFFLMDDAFRLGEYIDAGGIQGTIEKISIRSIQLRGANGPIHIVPYGEIPKLTNMSRDWVIMKLRFTVPFDTDVEKVRKLFKKIGQDMMAMDEFKDDIIAPFKGQGVADVDEVGIVVRGKFTTKPGKQFGVRKEVYRRVQHAFEENGIQFARREVRVQLPPALQDLPEDQKQQIATAAAGAADPPKTPTPAA